MAEASTLSLLTRSSSATLRESHQHLAASMLLAVLHSLHIQQRERHGELAGGRQAARPHNQACFCIALDAMLESSSPRSHTVPIPLKTHPASSYAHLLLNRHSSLPSCMHSGPSVYMFKTSSRVSRPASPMASLPVAHSSVLLTTIWTGRATDCWLCVRTTHRRTRRQATALQQ
jgi:hypothetical protein